MPAYNYYNSVGNKVSATAEVNMIQKKGPMSFCGAVEISDQHGCKHREDATRGKHCLYYRENYDGACDCMWAQNNLIKPKPEPDEDDDVEQAMTIVPT